MQKYARGSSENLIAYNFYSVQKGYPFFMKQIEFYESALAHKSLQKAESEKVLEHLEIQIKTNFGAEDQLLALKEIDRLRSLL